MINSKQKGKTGELELVKKLKEHGYDCRRSVQYNGKADAGQPDLIGLPYIHIECKRVEKLNIDEALNQAIRDSKNNIPAVFHRRNNTNWKVTLTLEEFLVIYREYESSMKLKEKILSSISWEGQL